MTFPCFEKRKLSLSALLPLFLILFLSACDQFPPSNKSAPVISAFPVAVKPPPLLAAVEKDTFPAIDYDTIQWAELVRLDSQILIDIRYASTNNFVDTIMYDCGRCFLRPEVAGAVLAAQQELKTRGYRLMMLDCYRPRPVQWRLWEKVPDPRYVSDPRKGSMHNRGAAVDLTLASPDGNELDMGTPYDFFGKEAYPAFTGLPDSILQRRKLLSETMVSKGFRAIRTEWWHFAFTGKGYPLADWEWPCPEYFRENH